LRRDVERQLENPLAMVMVRGEWANGFYAPPEYRAFVAATGIKQNDQ